MALEAASNKTDPWLHRYAVATALATLGLIGMGGLVTSHGAGMAVPDWPTSYGYNMFALPIHFWKGGVFYEHAHRLWASEVGLLTIILNFWLFGRRARLLVKCFGALLVAAAIATVLRTHSMQAGLYFGLHGLGLLAASFVWPNCAAAPRWLRVLGIIALILVVLQGVLGGLRVVLFKDQIGVFHAALAQLFLALIAAIALFTSQWWRKHPSAEPSVPDKAVTPPVGGAGAPKKWLLLGATVLIFLQLVIAATMRHQHAGLAIPDFPLAYGKLWPATSEAAVTSYNARRIEVTAANPITAFQIWLQMVHRGMAVVILGAVGLCAWRMRGMLKRPALAWLGLILVQIALGAWTIWSNKAADIATLHVVVGALSLVMGVLLTIIAFRFSAQARS